MRRLFVVCIRVYQIFLSPYTYSACRFQPTCSEYAAQAVDKHGCLRGGLKTVFRLLRCHPLGGCGYDPVDKV